MGRNLQLFFESDAKYIILPYTDESTVEIYKALQNTLHKKGKQGVENVPKLKEQTLDLFFSLQEDLMRTT